MNIKSYVRGAALATLLVAGTVAAQVAPGITISTTPSNSFTPGTTNAFMGTISVSGPNGGAQLTTVPIQFTVLGGGSLSNLSNCHIVNSGGTTVGSQGGLASGVNNFPISPSITVNNMSITTLTLRCNIAANAPLTAEYLITSPMGTVTPGGTVNIANVVISGNAQNNPALSVPITVTAANGGSLSNLSSCRLVNSNGVAVTGSLGNLSSGANTFSFSPALTAGGSTGTVNLTLRCDTAAGTPSGATFSAVAGSVVYSTGSTPLPGSTINLGNLTIVGHSLGAPALSVPVTFSASAGGQLSQLSNCRLVNMNEAVASNISSSIVTNPATFVFSPSFTGNSTLSLRCDLAAGTPSGATFSAAAGAVLYGAGTGTGTGTGTGGGTGTGTPGVPSTGIGEIANTLGMLALAALAAVGGGFYLRRSLR